ncbi:MAG: helix-turn-helix transcriptional regulator [Lachnospiraceae bacterium]|nr:helix-turn-helix transcriptional regulator [Lachnospiraceae bacterium]
MVNGLGYRLQEQRQLSKLSQKEVASAIGISPSVISNYESGERTPSVEILMALASLYRCSTDYLLGLDKSNCASYIDTSNLSASQHKLLQNFLESLQ